MQLGIAATDCMLNIQASKLAESRNARPDDSQDIQPLPSKKGAVGLRERGAGFAAKTYMDQLILSKKWWFVFYDTDDVRGWFVDGPSALLHLVRASLFRYKNDPDVGERFVFKFKEDSDSGNPSYRALMNPDNLGQELRRGCSESFEDKVKDIWSTLELVIAKQEDLNAESRNIPEQIEGFQFVDIARDNVNIRVCTAELEAAKSTWLNLTRIPKSNTAVLFGRGFGELIRPSNTSLNVLCQCWQKLPKKQGYLAARGCDIAESLQHKLFYDNGNKTWQIGSNPNKCHWLAPIYRKQSVCPASAYSPGEVPCCEKAHVILPDEVVRSMGESTFPCLQKEPPECGAIIFGFSSQCPKYWEQGRLGEARGKSTTPARQLWLIQRISDLLIGKENISTGLLPLCAHMLTSLVCTAVFCSSLASVDSFCGTVGWSSCFALGSSYFILWSAGWRFGSTLLSLAFWGFLILIFSWCIILTPIQILFTTPLEQWKIAPNYIFVPHHIKYQPPSSGGIDAE